MQCRSMGAANPAPQSQVRGSARVLASGMWSLGLTTEVPHLFRHEWESTSGTGTLGQFSSALDKVGVGV